MSATEPSPAIPLPPQHLQVHVGSGFMAVGAEFVGHLRNLAGLRQEMALLDIGCGAGRLAIPLAGVLAGRYEGFDVHRESVDWCRENIAPRHPGFGFTHADLRNTMYNPAGTEDPDTFHFPYDDASFDVAIAVSVFTHLLPTTAAHYLAEASRVLRPGGVLFGTWFLVDADAEARIAAGQCSLDFAPQDDTWLVRGVAPEYAVGRRDDDVLADASAAGMVLDGPVHRGTWPGRPSGLSYQDVVVLRNAR